jgi:hypothetical protein
MSGWVSLWKEPFSDVLAEVASFLLLMRKKFLIFCPAELLTLALGLRLAPVKVRFAGSMGVEGMLEVWDLDAVKAGMASRKHR